MQCLVELDYSSWSDIATRNDSLTNSARGLAFDVNRRTIYE
jgi:hypothetical protein